MRMTVSRSSRMFLRVVTTEVVGKTISLRASIKTR